MYFREDAVSLPVPGDRWWNLEEPGDPPGLRREIDGLPEGASTAPVADDDLHRFETDGADDRFGGEVQCRFKPPDGVPFVLVVASAGDQGQQRARLAGMLQVLGVHRHPIR